MSGWPLERRERREPQTPAGHQQLVGRREADSLFLLDKALAHQTNSRRGAPEKGGYRALTWNPVCGFAASIRRPGQQGFRDLGYIELTPRQYPRRGVGELAGAILLRLQTRPSSALATFGLGPRANAGQPDSSPHFAPALPSPQVRHKVRVKGCLAEGYRVCRSQMPFRPLQTCGEGQQFKQLMPMRAYAHEGRSELQVAVYASTRPLAFSRTKL